MVERPSRATQGKVSPQPPEPCCRQEADMDLLSIARKIWRYKLLTLPVFLLTFCGAVYAVAIKDPVYEAKSSYLLINPPAPPTPEELAQDPTNRGRSADNPYTRFADQSVVVQVLTSALSSEPARRKLTDAGADSRYTVAPIAGLGYSSPIVEITGVGRSPETAIRTADLVANALMRELKRMQDEQGVDPEYEIRTQQIAAPHAELRASGQARMLVAVLVGGAVLMFLVVSVAEAVSGLRLERRERALWEGPVGDGETWSAGPWPPPPEAGIDPGHEINSNGDSGHDEVPVDLSPDREWESPRLGHGGGTRSLPDDQS
jgi:hypothetical protein